METNQSNQLTLITAETMSTAVRHQKSSEPTWIDETGNNVPYARVTKTERLMEKTSAKIFKGALSISTMMEEYKKELREACDLVYKSYMAEKEATPNKGNFTWYNFDRSLKIVVKNQEAIQFDDMALTAAKSLLDEFLSENVSSNVEFLKELVMDAFSSSNGSVDSKKVMGLIRYESKIKAEKFLKAVGILKEGIRRPKSKVYFSIWYKDANGEYKAVELNFSNIE